MYSGQSMSAVLPPEICGCPVDRALSEENQTYLAIGPGGRGIVLKKLDPDCLWRDTIHPSIKERLSRVRELAHSGIANLLGVSREDEDAYLMWEYIEGMPFDEYLSDLARSPRELATLARELIFTVDLLHAQGVVHGALIGGNVIVTSSGAVRLTHVSPLLYTDFAVDIECVLSLLEQVVEERGEQDSKFGRLLVQAREQKMTLRALGTSLANIGEIGSPSVDRPAGRPMAVQRRRALFGAALAAGLGIATVMGLRHVVQHGAAPGGSLSAPDATARSDSSGLARVLGN